MRARRPQLGGGSAQPGRRTLPDRASGQEHEPRLAYGSLTVLSAYRVRELVIAAIEAGASCRQAAERLGVGKASAIRWHARYRAEGVIAAKPMGGDRHSHRTKAHAALILQALEVRIPMKSAMHSNLKPARYSDLMSAT
ncbi:MAG: hypothetical protein B7Z75_13445 [Acidocella sp. 20-57-95]|nr:MAG: hypothetical protein B7Z75_13445 [Acidocella sp. 20-57-95]OYV62077.1 MAG: hypothetical protein B7Z71_02650 [Acidocella sp. 21-58-7]